MVFQCINICQVPWEVLKTAAFGLGFQHLPRVLADVNAWKTMFVPYIHLLPNIWTEKNKPKKKYRLQSAATEYVTDQVQPSLSLTVSF